MTWLTVDEVAAELRCARGTILAEIRRHNLRATKVAARWLIARDDVQRYIDAGYTTNVPAGSSNPGSAASRSPAGLQPPGAA